MAVAGVVVLTALVGKLLGGRSLRRGIEVLDLGFAEDAVTTLTPTACARLLVAAHIYVLLLGDLYTSGLLMTKRTYRSVSGGPADELWACPTG